MANIPYKMTVYNDDPSKAVDIDEQFEKGVAMCETLKALGHIEAAELARPVRLFRNTDPNFSPLATIEKLEEFGKQGRAAIALARETNDGIVPEFLWSGSPTVLSRLVDVKLNEGVVVGFIVLFDGGDFAVYPELADYAPLLRLWAGAATRPAPLTSAVEFDQIVDKIENFFEAPAELLKAYSDWSDSYEDPLHESDSLQ